MAERQPSTLPGLTPERLFLLEAIKSLLHRKDRVEMPPLATYESWERLIQLAADHRLLPLLYRFLASSRLSVPLPLANALNSHTREVAARSRVAAAQLLEVLGQLQSAGIRAIPFKGPLLAAAAYGDLSAREFSDLDVIVRHSDLRPACFVLRCAGFRIDHSSRYANALISVRGEHHFPFVRQNAVPIEVHTGFAPAAFHFPLERSGIWDRARTEMLLGQPVTALAPEDLLLALCLHGAKHSWRCLEFVVAVAFLVRAAPELDWEATLCRARMLGGVRMLALGMILADELLELPCPQSIREAVASDPVFEGLHNDALHRFAVEPDCTWGPRQRASFHWRCRERLRDRLLYLWNLAATPNQEDFNSWPLPSALQFLYFPFRPVRLLFSYASVIGRRATKT